MRERAFYLEPSIPDFSLLAALASSLALRSAVSKGFVRKLVCICGDRARSRCRLKGEGVAPRLGTGCGSIRLNF
jgi:hypothetical protein